MDKARVLLQHPLQLTARRAPAEVDPEIGLNTEQEVFMPLVRIDMTAGRDPGAHRAIADAVHAAIVSAYGIPERDRFQVLTERPAECIIAHDAGLGFERRLPVIIQIFTQRGRSDETKQRLYDEIAQRLGTVGVAGEDVFIGYVENGPQDWSFGFGRAQYMTGELAVPGAGRSPDPGPAPLRRK